MRLSKEGFSIDAAIAKERALPEWFLDEPPLPPGAELFFDAFRELSTCRSWGDQPGPIPWTAIMQYTDHAAMSDRSQYLFVPCIRAMDEAYLAWTYKEIEKARKQKT